MAVKIPKGTSRAVREKIKAFIQHRADIRLLAETLKRAMPEGKIVINGGYVSIGGGKRAYAKYRKKAGKD